jgi:hypothetical protein
MQWGIANVSKQLVGGNSESIQLKPYVKPTFVKGPALPSILAQSKVSSGGQAPAPSCWVARAAFGLEDIRWMIFRAWMLEDAPAWFRSLYLRHGETIGAWLADRPQWRRLVRALMMPAIRHKLLG